jgi:hypothetical protein
LGEKVRIQELKAIVAEKEDLSFNDLFAYAIPVQENLVIGEASLVKLFTTLVDYDYLTFNGKDGFQLHADINHCELGTDFESHSQRV